MTEKERELQLEQETALDMLSKVAGEQDLEQWKQKFLGKNALVVRAFSSLGSVRCAVFIRVTLQSVRKFTPSGTGRYKYFSSISPASR